MYGYQLRAEFGSRTGSTWPLNIGQVYTTLRRLARAGLVEGDEDPAPQVPAGGAGHRPPAQRGGSRGRAEPVDDTGQPPHGRPAATSSPSVTFGGDCRLQAAGGSGTDRNC
ncbi:PadR family transcriptional regulator [Parafrankia discariae]|uniref:PadR family transcriptional regulator n=1 Tax=Parafrankia discariae TaxID=365528 RepID=UPI00039A97BF|nr:helix-turn-helix transcriptional regulator [Parafrankia discariae]